VRELKTAGEINIEMKKKKGKIVNFLKKIIKRNGSFINLRRDINYYIFLFKFGTTKNLRPLLGNPHFLPSFIYTNLIKKRAKKVHNKQEARARARKNGEVSQWTKWKITENGLEKTSASSVTTEGSPKCNLVQISEFEKTGLECELDLNLDKSNLSNQEREKIRSYVKDLQSVAVNQTKETKTYVYKAPEPVKFVIETKNKTVIDGDLLTVPYERPVEPVKPTGGGQETISSPAKSGVVVL
jgi:hypothetical protein